MITKFEEFLNEEFFFPKKKEKPITEFGDLIVNDIKDDLPIKVTANNYDNCKEVIREILSNKKKVVLQVMGNGEENYEKLLRKLNLKASKISGSDKPWFYVTVKYKKSANESLDELNEEYQDPNRPMAMQALESFLKMGFKLTRRSWEPGKFIIMTKPDAKILLYIDGQRSTERLTEEDMRARDWKVIRPEKR